MNESDYSIEYFNNELNKIYRQITKNKYPVSNPKAFILGGQPGCGKTRLQQLMAKKCNGNVVIINADEFRERHPNFEVIQNKYGKNSVDYTSEFLGKMTEALVLALKKANYNIIVEGTLRTAQVPLDTCEKFKESGYDVSLVVIAVKPEISFISTIKRYEEMIAKGYTPRATQKEAHDYVVSQIPNNLFEIYKSQKFDEILIYDRKDVCLYDMKEAPTVLPNAVINDMLNGKWTQQELSQFFEIGTVTQTMMEKRNSEELSSFTANIFNAEIISEIAKENDLEVTKEMKYYFESKGVKNSKQSIQNENKLLNSDYDIMSEKDLSDLKKVCDKDWLSLAMWKGNKAEEINRITYNYNGSMWRGNVFSKGKAVGDFVAFEFEAIMKKLPQVSVMIKAETLIKEKDITPKNFEKKKEMISQKVSEAKKNNRKATYENTSYQEKAMIEKEKYNTWKATKCSPCNSCYNSNYTLKKSELAPGCNIPFVITCDGCTASNTSYGCYDCVNKCYDGCTTAATSTRYSSLYKCDNYCMQCNTSLHGCDACYQKVYTQGGK